MPATTPTTVLGKLAALQTELVDQAYNLERQGRVDAADMVITTAARVGQLCAELDLQDADAARPATTALHSSAR